MLDSNQSLLYKITTNRWKVGFAVVGEENRGGAWGVVTVVEFPEFSSMVPMVCHRCGAAELEELRFCFREVMEHLLHTEIISM